MKRLLFFVIISSLLSCESPLVTKKDSFVTRFERSEGKETPTYEEVIKFYKDLVNSYSSVNFQTMGLTDSGYPLHIVVYNPEGNFNFVNLREKNKRFILINNGIHPGESDGIDATMILFRNLAQGQIKAPKNTIIVAIPIYNVGGALERNSTTRVNQNGPKYYGFRGNAQNYDLNRDFIKMDSKNMQSFAEIFHLVQPDVFIDTHVSNGADYQYTLTHLFTQHNKLQGSLGNYLQTEFMPALTDSLKAKDLDITPYVNVFNKAPETGFAQFMDYPRYSTGYTTLWNTLGLMIETHMLKPYKQRVEATYELMKSLVNITDKQAKRIGELRKMAFDEIGEDHEYPVDWEIDSTKYTSFLFKGYKADTIISEVTGFPRLKYNRDEPFEQQLKYYNYYKPKETVRAPEAYIIPQSWYKVIDKLNTNRIEYHALEKDSTAYVTYYKIESFETVTEPFEGHYMHFNTKVTAKKDSINFRKGDYVIPVNQPGKRYLIATLEPVAPDSFFNWNFFDPVLQQKEHFSPYVFEDIASEMLKKDPKLKTQFLSKKEQDTAFANNWHSQLEWIYERSKYYEKAYRRYPVYRVEVPE